MKKQTDEDLPYLPIDKKQAEGRCRCPGQEQDLVVVQLDLEQADKQADNQENNS
jgi:hypothetical protein